MTAGAPDGYLPSPARIVGAFDEGEDTRTFRLELEADVIAAARPGQFLMLSLFGLGEAAFTVSGIAGEPGAAQQVDLTIRRVGSLTSALFRLGVGDLVGLRGPFGRGFTVYPSEPAVYMAGGCGLSPLKWAIEAHLAARPAGLPIAIVYGARTEPDRIHRAALAAWRALPEVEVIECVEAGDAGWSGLRGRCTDFVTAAVAAVGARRAAVGGPPLMLRAAADALRGCGLPADRIELAIERHMKCATGHCGHCYVGARYVCRDGPVFTLAELDRLPEAFDSPDAGPVAARFPS